MATEPPTRWPWPGAEAIGHIIPVQTRHAVFEQDQEIDGVFLLISGVAKVLQRCQTGSTVMLGLRGPGWLLGGVPAMFVDRHVATVVAAKPCRVAFMPRREFDQHLKAPDATFVTWLTYMLGRNELAHYEHAVAMTRSISCRSRVKYIVLLCFKFGGVPQPDGSIVLELDVTVQELANYAQFSRDQVNRVLGELEEKGLIVRDRGLLIIPVSSPWCKSLLGSQ